MILCARSSHRRASEIALVCSDCEYLAKRVELLERENRELRERLEKLERLLRRLSPARVVPAFVKPNVEEKEAKSSGRPEGHEGVGRSTPDEIHKQVKLKPVRKCPDCGKRVGFKGVRSRVITRLVPGHLENVRYEIPEGYCNGCRQTVEPVVPNALPNSRFDLTLALWIACLRMLGVSVDKIRFLLRTDYGLHVSSATVVNTCGKLAEFLGGDYEQLRLELLKEKQAHGDETSWRVKGRNWWLWEFIGKRVAYFTIRHTRGHEVPEQVMRGFTGVFSSDFWSAYNVLTCEKQKCWVHLKRELDKVLKYKHSHEFAAFASRLMRLYYWAKSERNHGRKTREFAEKRLHALLSQEYANKDCKRLVKRLTRHEKEMFTFCAHKGAADGNNHAERGIRPAVVMRKTTFGSQSEEGANTTAVLMSFFQTARLQDANFIEYLQEIVNNRLQN